MIDHHDRPDHSQTTPANDDGTDALERDDIQEAQDQAGIAGEPQPVNTEQEPEEPASPPR